jgi:hypothetical protein
MHPPWPTPSKLAVRASFTRVLKRLCTRLDEDPVGTVSVAEQGYYPAYSATAKITSLAVVRSYARGAATCGDWTFYSTWNSSRADATDE